MDELNAEKMKLLERISQVLTPMFNGIIPGSLEQREAAGKEREEASKRIAQIENEIMLTTQELKIAEIDEMTLPFDFDTDFGTSGVNSIVRQMLKEERSKNFSEFNIEYAKVNAEADAKIAGFEERESQLQRQNQDLQKIIEHGNAENKAQIHEIGTLRDFVNGQNERIENLNNDLRNLELRNAEIEQNRKNAADMLEKANEEIERLNDHINDLRKQIAVGARQAHRVVDVTETTQSLYEKAKQATADKRKMMITANLGLYTEVADEDGKKEVVRNNELEGLEIVDSFQLPEIEDITELPENANEEVTDGTTGHVATENLVLEGSGDITSSNEGEAEADTAETDSSETVTQETSNSQEVGETFEQWATREINALKSVVFGAKELTFTDEDAA